MSLLQGLYQRLVGRRRDADESDLDAAARDREPASVAVHLASLALSKMADGVLNPKLVLAALIQALGAPAGLVGLVAPVREAGALLPQPFIADRVDQAQMTRFFWVVGAAGQSASALGIGLFALLTDGLLAGVGMLACLAVLALSRSLCSASYKALLGKTVDEGRRGRVTGLAGSTAALATLIAALLLIVEAAPREDLLRSFIFVAALAWSIAALVMSRLPEIPSDEADGDAPEDDPLARYEPILKDAWFWRFIATRALLSATSFAPPFFLLAFESGAALAHAGWLILAGALAGLISGAVWGWLADRSSRMVLVAAALIASLALAAAGALAVSGDWTPPIAAGLLFVLMVAYEGVRLGRSTYLVDMTPQDERARYGAAANLVMGVLLLAGGGFAALAEIFNAGVALISLAALAALAILPALSLPASRDDRTD